MKTETTYICEICGGKYFEAAHAEECEARGVPANLLPVGLLEMGEPGDFYDDKLAFSIAGSRIEGHSVGYCLWACRDNGNGDSLGKDVCGNGGCMFAAEFSPRWLNRPPMIRLIKWMRENGHTPLISVGGKIISLDEHLERRVFP